MGKVLLNSGREGGSVPMTTVVKHARGKPRPAPWRTRTGLRLAVFAVLLAVVMIGGDPMPAAGDEGAAGVGLAIQPTARARLISSFEPRYVVGGDGTVAGEAVPAGDVAEVSIATNTSDWGVVVRFTLPEGGKPKHRNAAARCRLVDQEGLVVSEQFIENGEVLLEGNGRRGYLTFFLEVDGLLDAFGIEALTDPMVEVEGRVAIGGM
jgi:hypothetical protein